MRTAETKLIVYTQQPKNRNPEARTNVQYKMFSKHQFYKIFTQLIRIFNSTKSWSDNFP